MVGSGSCFESYTVLGVISYKKSKKNPAKAGGLFYKRDNEVFRDGLKKYEFCVTACKGFICFSLAYV